MAARTSMEIRPEHGYIALGGLRLTLAADGEGVLRVGAAARVRAPSFEEREHAVHDALGADDPAPALIAILADRSILDRGDLSAGVLDLVAVALAGGEEPDRSFAESARLAGEREGWSWGQILNRPAWIVDRAARSGDGDNGWSTIVFSGPEPADLDVLTREIAETLLRRIVDVDHRPAAARDASPERSRPFERVSERRMASQPDLGDSPSRRTHESSEARACSTHVVPAVPAPATAPLLHAHDFRGGVGQSQSVPIANPRSTQAAAVPGRWPADPSAARASAQRHPEPLSATRATAATGFAPVQTRASARRQAPEMPAPIESSPRAVMADPAVAYFPPGWSHAATARDALAAPATASAAERGPDWMEELARALGAECDLRGIDR